MLHTPADASQHFLLNVDSKDFALWPDKISQGNREITHTATQIQGSLTRMDQIPQDLFRFMHKPAQRVIERICKPPGANFV
jgi:hypothetical protein